MDSSVYLGVWTNWDHGRVYGLTLTTDQPWSDVLVAAIALVITFTGTQIWGVVCFVAFRVRQSAIGDYIYHHVQVVLRNSSGSPTSFAWKVLQIIFSQRTQNHHRPDPPPIATGLIQGFKDHSHADSDHPQHADPSERHTGEKARRARGWNLARLSCLLGLAAVFSAAFTAISVMGSQFVKAADNSVLIASDYCGWPAEVSNVNDLATPEARDTSALLMVPSRARYQRSRVYARSCYAEQDDGELSKQCDVFVTPRIASTLTTGNACPFPGAGVCKTDAVRIESGTIDSRDVLGINTTDEDRVGVKKSWTCAPIDADQWATDWVDGAPWGFAKGDSIKGYAVGTVPGGQPPVSEYPFVTTKYSSLFASDAYPLWWQTFMPGNDSALVSTFRPRDELQVADADLTLVALLPLAFFDEEIPDPWFNITIHQQPSSDSGLLTGSGIWLAPLGFSILGCLERYQFCASGICSQPSPLYQLRASSTYGLSSMTTNQKAVADLVWKSLWAAQLQYGLLFIANEILVANEQVMGNWYMRSSKLPSDQWTIEAWNLANISLAALQRRPGDYASPAPVLRENSSRLIQPETAAARALCQQIKIRTTRYTSFRVLSLALLAAVAAFMALLNGVLPYFFSKAASSHGRGNHEASEWDEYNIFHLIRSACEARGIGPWDRRGKTVPTMRERNRKFSLRTGGWSDTAETGPSC